MFKNDAARKAADRAKKAAKNKKRQRTYAPRTKHQIIKKDAKIAEAAALQYAKDIKKQENQAARQPNDSPNSNNAVQLLPRDAFQFDDDSIDTTGGIDSTLHSNRPYRPTASYSREKKQKRIRKDFWAQESVNLKEWYLQSFEIHGHPDPCLKVPKKLKKAHQCNCSTKKTMEIYCYMLHNHVKISVDHCIHYPILKTLVLMQMLPSSTIQPKAAIHFAVFEKLMSLKMNGNLSNYAFVRTQNVDNLFLSNYDESKFKNLNNGLFNTLQVIYRNLKSHVMDDLKLFDHSLYCHACAHGESVGVVMDGNFQLKRKKNKRNRNDIDLHPSIFSQSYDIAQLWETEGEVEVFANETDDTKYEMCGLEELDNNNPTFKAASEKSRKVSNRFDEEGVFSMNCARHGVPMRLYDIYHGEGRKYALAAISHLMKSLSNSQKLLIMYDIICLCRGRLESCIPGLKERAPLYLVTVFHAYAHSVHCQVEHHPRVINGSGNTDGEGVERFWSTANRFISMIRQMSKSNRKALLTDVVAHFRQNKMLEIPGQISKKYSNALSKVGTLNITNQEYFALEKQWNEHVEFVRIPATAAGVQILLSKAEQETDISRYSYYLKLVIEYLMLQELRDESGQRIQISETRDINRNNFLVDQIQQLRTRYQYPTITNLNDPALREHKARIIQVRYNVLNTFIKHLLFAILMKEHKISQPGSFGTAKAAKVITSIEVLKKKAEAIIRMINKFVDDHYSTQAERNQKKKQTVGRELERIRLYAAENGLDLPTPLNNWHTLKRNIEEISILIGEAKLMISNYEGELMWLEGKGSSYFVRMRKLDVTRRFRKARSLLSVIARSTAPKLSPSREEINLLDNVVIFPDADFSDDNTDADNHDDENEIVDEGDPDDADPAEGGEPNPEDEVLITFHDIEEEA